MDILSKAFCYYGALSSGLYILYSIKMGLYIANQSHCTTPILTFLQVCFLKHTKAKFAGSFLAFFVKHMPTFIGLGLLDKILIEFGYNPNGYSLILYRINTVLVPLCLVYPRIVIEKN